MHAAKLLSDEEVFALEDCIADFIEVQSDVERVTMDLVHSNRTVAKLHKLVALSEQLKADSAFSRQARRKYV